MALNLVLDTDIVCDLFKNGAWEELNSEFPHAHFYISVQHLIEAYSAFQDLGLGEQFFGRMNFFFELKNRFVLLYPTTSTLLGSIDLMREIEGSRRSPRLLSIWLAAMFNELMVEEPNTFLRTSSLQDFVGLVPPGALMDP